MELLHISKENEMELIKIITVSVLVQLLLWISLFAVLYVIIDEFFV